MSAGSLLSVEVVWIGIEPPLRVPVTVAAGSTVADAIAASGIVARIAATGRLAADAGPLDDLSVAVFGRRCSPADRLHEGDRVELLPPLTVDPKVARQRRAEHRRRLAGERRWTPDRERPIGTAGRG
jgi:putative ubiquitin-RnfH superfamily antitoxin RatB of RatAB toxin-antitoxin module